MLCSLHSSLIGRGSPDSDLKPPSFVCIHVLHTPKSTTYDSTEEGMREEEEKRGEKRGKKGEKRGEGEGEVGGKNLSLTGGPYSGPRPTADQEEENGKREQRCS